MAPLGLSGGSHVNRTVVDSMRVVAGGPCSSGAGESGWRGTEEVEE